MDLGTARELAQMLDGEAYPANDDEDWLVLVERSDGRVVVLSKTSVEEYADRQALEAGHCYACISLA